MLFMICKLIHEIYSQFYAKTPFKLSTAVFFKNKKV